MAAIHTLKTLMALAAIAVLAPLPWSSPAGATTLITATEAQYPPDNSELRAGIERGPDVIAVYPKPKSGLIQSPFTFRVKFVPHGNTQVDLNSLVVIYKKTPAVDLTERVRPFVQPSGIDMPDAEVPPGVHRIWIFIRDTAGHEGRADIRFGVEP